ncbi:MAG: ABC transporter substrate-binding protein [Clostridia bacterium]|nr:ABC transporter substrate-binding protein [Clostridia bacterium]
MKKLLALVVALVLVLPAAALASAANNTFIYGIGGDPGNDINTISTSGRFDLTAERLLYSPLFNYYGPDDIEYRLAESFELSEDGQTLTVHLRQDVVWSDGEPFTADDVVFTYQTIIDTDYANGHDAFVFGDEKVTVEKTDDYTVVFQVPVYFPALLENIGAEHYIMAKHIYEGDETLDNNPKNATPVGTGPFVLDEYVAGQYMKFSANKTYFLGEPKVETLILQFVTDQTSALLALQTGEINALVIDNTSDADDLDVNAVTVYAYPEDRVGYLGFNLSGSRASDINLRKAAFYAINRTELNLGTYISEDYYVDAVSFLPYSNPYVTNDLEDYAYNPEKSAEYLAQVEGDIPTLRLAYTANNLTQETQALIIQQQLKAAGIDVELKAMDGTALTNLYYEEHDEYDLFIGGYIMGIDPSSYATLFVSDGSANFYHVADEELDGYFAAADVETDPDARLALYQDAQRRLADLAVQYPIVTNLRLLAVTNDVSGVEDARLIPIYTFSNFDQLSFN